MDFQSEKFINFFSFKKTPKHTQPPLFFFLAAQNPKTKALLECETEHEIIETSAFL